MEKGRPGILGHRSELQQQLQLLGDVLKPFLTLKTESEKDHKYWTTKDKVCGRGDSQKTWKFLHKIFHEKVYGVIEARYDILHDKAVAEKSTGASKTDHAYNHELMGLCIDCLYALDELILAEGKDFYGVETYPEECSILAKHFVNFISFLYAVPHPDVANKDVTWMLAPCKIYQDNTEFMDLLRDLSVLFIFVVDLNGDNLNVPKHVLDICQYYSKLARDDYYARIFERGILHKIKKGEHTLKDDELQQITDIAKYKQTQSHTHSMRPEGFVSVRIDPAHRELRELLSELYLA